MNKEIKDILEKANETYSNGEVYILTDQELEQVNTILHLNLTEKELVDSVYDIIYSTAKKLYSKDSYFNQLQSTNTGYGKEIIHTEPMGSMEELKEGDWAKWKGNHKKFLQSDKLDGCSIILTYQKGILYSAATRGRGIKGKCIMRHIPSITNIPQKITNQEESLVVRGELLVPKAELPIMLKEVSELEGKEQKNGRNTIAGALNRKETNEVVFKHAHFVAYWDSINKGQGIEKLKGLGFEIPYITEIDNNTTEEDLIKKVEDRIANSKYELDGIILTQLDNPEEGLETGTINPKASRKFKIGIYNNSAESTVLNITWQISKNCKLTPVLNIEPIELCGSTISNVTGHNYQNLVDKQCGIGSRVKIKRAGLVIPYLEEVLSSSTDLNLPSNTYIKGVDLYSNEATNDVYVRKLVHFAKVFDLDQAGEASMEKILEYSKLYEDPVFLFSLDKDMAKILLGVNGIKLYNSIQKVFNEGVTEAKLADACGCFGEGFGESLLSRIEQKYGSLVPLTEEIEDFGPARMKQYNENYLIWLSDYSIYKSLDGKIKKLEVKTDLLLSDKVICFTGIRDKEFAKELENNGAIVTDTFNKKVNVLIAKDITGNSSKLQKAKEQGCLILSLDQAKAQLLQK